MVDLIRSPRAPAYNQIIVKNAMRVIPAKIQSLETLKSTLKIKNNKADIQNYYIHL